MKFSNALRSTLSTTLLALLIAASPTASQAAVELYAKGAIPGTAADTSGLSGNLSDGTPHNRMGGFGSAITYTGIGNSFIAVPDRGPADGTTNYLDRYYTLDIPLTAGVITPALKSTVLLRDQEGRNLTGSAAAFDTTTPTSSLRFDPEGVRVAYNRKIYISDEYGPYIHEFDSNGTRTRTIRIPDKFAIANPSADSASELGSNSSGRQANRGMEGLAISPDGTKLFGMMQNALIQDHALDSGLSRIGRYNRMLEIDLMTGATKEYAYKLEGKSYGVNEILAINDHQFLVIERDGKAGSSAVFKKIYRIDITGASDVSTIASLPEKGDLQDGLIPVSKAEFIDLLAAGYGLAGSSFSEKVEGLAFGPDLADGRHTLLVTTDNDFSETQPSNIWVFAIDPADLPDFQRQQFQYDFSDVSSQARATTSSFTYNRSTKQYSGKLTITNTGTARLAGPLTVALADLTAGIDLVNPTGSYNGIPAITGIAPAGLNPGESVVIPAQFTNPSNLRISFRAITLTTTNAASTQFAVFSDPHLYDPALGTTSAEFQAYLAQDRKLIAESGEILDSVIDDLKSKPLDFVMITGDLTKDGERVNHEKMATKLAELKASGKKVYVIPGNHDVNNPDSLSFRTSPPTAIASVDPAAFKQIYAPYGYKDALFTDPGSLSYIVEPAPGVWLFALDSCQYGVTAGAFNYSTQSWVLDRLNAAKNQGKKVIGTMHHGILEHFTGQSLQFPEYVVNDWRNISRLFSDNGLNVMFTGHYHANDVTLKDFTTSVLHDVETGSTVTYPSPYRIVNFNTTGNTLDIRTKRVTSIASHPSDFPAFSLNYLQTGMTGIVGYQLSHAPYNLTDPTLSYITGLVVPAFMAHYAGDETPDASTTATYMGMMQSPDAVTKGLGQSLYSLWTDLAPADNNLTITIGAQ
ncbi:MAG: esterase-like activity of phytase family protein [Pedobacter sp.]